MAPRDILVAIIEDDVFSRNWMSLLLVRDWRTRLVAEFMDFTEFQQQLDAQSQVFDILIVDVDLFGERFTIDAISRALAAKNQQTKILLTGIKPKLQVVRQINNFVCGYVLKHEVGYSLSWVISFIDNDFWVMTPGTQALLDDVNFQFSTKTLILGGRKKFPGFTDHETEVARMAFIFSLARRDLADELKISEQWSYGLVSELYKKLGLSDIIAGDADLFTFIGESEVIRNRFKEIMERIGPTRKARDMETLAYHLITMPEIIQ